MYNDKPFGGTEGERLPELPEGWVWATWEQLSPRVTVGFVGPMKHEYVESGIKFLRSQNVRENRFDPEGLKYISRGFHERISKSTLNSGDIVVVRSGSVGVTCVIPEDLGEANCADLVIVKKPLGMIPQFGSFYMNSLAKRRVREGQVGVALIHFNTKSDYSGRRYIHVIRTPAYSITQDAG
jgi:type I restriction enzyme S subunit